MKTASLTHTKNNLSALVEQVKGGESVLILERGVPVARLEPVNQERSTEGRVERLERTGLLRRASVEKRTAVIKTPPPALADGESAVEALLDERRTGR